jgi:hypothetical protein
LIWAPAQFLILLALAVALVMLRRDLRVEND